MPIRASKPPNCRKYRLTSVLPPEYPTTTALASSALRLRRSNTSAESGYDLCIDPTERTVRLNEQLITRVEGLTQPFCLDLIAKDTIIDLCIDDRRCLIDRCPEQTGDILLLYAPRHRRHLQRPPDYAPEVSPKIILDNN